MCQLQTVFYIWLLGRPPVPTLLPQTLATPLMYGAYYTIGNFSEFCNVSEFYVLLKLNLCPKTSV